MAVNQASHIQQGSLEAIFDAPPGQKLTPILQCVQVKPIAPSTTQTERFRVVLSDIKNFVQTMLATQANHFVNDGKLKRGCFVRLTAYNASYIKGKK
jgi:replication factor A1